MLGCCETPTEPDGDWNANSSPGDTPGAPEILSRNPSFLPFTRAHAPGARLSKDRPAVTDQGVDSSILVKSILSYPWPHFLGRYFFLQYEMLVAVGEFKTGSSRSALLKFKISRSTLNPGKTTQNFGLSFSVTSMRIFRGSILNLVRGEFSTFEEGCRGSSQRNRIFPPCPCSPLNLEDRRPWPGRQINFYFVRRYFCGFCSPHGTAVWQPLKLFGAIWDFFILPPHHLLLLLS